MSMNEVLREFLLETHENLALLDSDLVTLEQKPTDKQTLAQVFRTLHSVKGTAGFIGLPKLQQVAHSAESLLSRLRDGELRFNQPIATALLKTVDAIREMLASIENNGAEGDGDYSAVIAEVDRLRLGGEAEPTPAPAAPVAPPALSSSPKPTLSPEVESWPTLAPPPPPKNQPASEPPVSHAASAATTSHFESPLPPRSESPPPRIDTPQPSVIPRPAAAPPTSSSAKTELAERPAPPAMPVPPARIDPSARTVALAPESPTSEPPQAEPTPAPLVPIIEVPAPISQTPSPPAPGEPSEPRATGLTDSNIRVDVGLLDKMMTLVGELVLSRNQIMQFGISSEDPAFHGAVQQLNLLTTELQTSVMKTRMQPIGNVWSKFPRIVRDLAVACQKKVRFEMEGQETELDKTLIEAIRDPLTHMVRNAVDHGIETPDVRRSRGKPEEGRLRLVAFHEGGKVIIEMIDDGGGINAQRVRDKAIQNKLITPQDASRLSHAEILRLIFLPGFSTAEKVTQFSGRGVGMDVVRTSIEKIGGTVEIESVEGQGTTIRMKIPLTLAIVPALVCSTAGERYAIPQSALLELVRLDAERASRGIEWMHGTPVFRLRGTLLPLAFLDELLAVPSRRKPEHDLFIVVLQADDRSFGLVVDGIRDTEEIVVKPLQKQLKGIPAFAGATIMGDGRVALILDVMGIAQRTGLVSQAKSKSMMQGEQAANEKTSDGEPLLIFSPLGGGQMAIPLSLVARLEELPRTTLERMGDSQVVQYRNEILPLIDVSRSLDQLAHGKPTLGTSTSDGALSETVPVVVCARDGKSVGLIVRNIVDIVNESIVTQVAASRPGVRFAAVIQGKVTEFIDVDAVTRDEMSVSAHGS